MKVKVRPAFHLLEILIILLYMNPIGNLVPNYIQILVFFLWMLVVLIEGQITKEIFNIAGGNFTVFIIIFIRTCFSGRIDLNDYFSPIQVCIGWYQLLVYSIIFVYVIKLKRNDKERLFMIAIISMTITAVFSIYYVIFRNPLAVRYSMTERYWGTGDFQIVYAVAVLVGPLAMLVWDKKRMCKYRPFMITSFVIMLLFLIISNLVTSVVIAFFSIMISFILEHVNGVKAFLFGMGITIVVLFRKLVGRLFLKLADSGTFFWSTSDKLRTIAGLLLGNTDNLNTLGLRIHLIKRSLKTFKDNWLFGVSFKEYGQDTLGSHNQWADDLGRFGVFGNIFVWWNYIRLFRQTLGFTRSKYIKNALISVWMTYFILGFLNPCLIGQVLAVIFVVVPTMYDEPVYKGIKNKRK